MSSITTSSSEWYERTEEIQKFLINHLELTPRRQLFEEFEKNSLLYEKEVDDQTGASLTSTKSNFKLDLDNLSELSEFRKNNPSECMSNVSRQRFQRAKEREQQLLNHPCSHYYIESKAPTPDVDVKQCASSRDQLRMRNMKIIPDKSLALSNQKFKS